MFGIGFFELCIIAIAALVVVGPQKLPGMMRQFGRFFVQLRRASNDVRSTFDTIVHDAENEIRREEMKLKSTITQSSIVINDEKLSDKNNAGVIKQTTENELQQVQEIIKSDPSEPAGAAQRSLWEKTSL